MDEDWTAGAWRGTHYDYVQRNIFLNHLAAPIEKGRCPGPVCGIGFDTRLNYGVDEAFLKSCPVCSKIVDVGLQTACKRLYTHYGKDIVQVLDGFTTLKPKIEKDDLDTQFRNVFKELESRLPKE